MTPATEETRLGLRIDLPDERAFVALPALRGLLDRFQVRATFFPTLGPGARGRLPWPRQPLGRRHRESLLALAGEGHEPGLTAWDPGRWRREILRRDGAWTRRQLARALEVHATLFGQRPRGVAVPGGLLNAAVPQVEADLGLDYALDTRGLFPFRPQGGGCVQLPLSLPTPEEALARGETPADLHQFVFMETQRPVLPGHVFAWTCGGVAPLEVLERLLTMWLGSQRPVGPVRDLYAQVRPEELPVHPILLREDPVLGTRAVQGRG